MTAFIGDVDYFKEEGLGIELFHGQGGPAVVQALIAGAIPLGDVGIGPAILASARGLPLVHPALGAIGTPTQPFSRIMVRGDSAITDVAQLKGKKLALHQRYFARNGLPVMPNLYHIYAMLVAGKAMDAVADPAKLFEEAVIEPTRQITLPVLDELGWDKDSVVQDMLRASYPLLPKPPEAYYAEWEKKLLGL